MIIGVDFDNTIVSYDNVFWKVAKELGLISEGLPVNKNAVRDFLRESDQEDKWTELQGYIYGARMEDAGLFQGFDTFLSRASALNHRVCIVSHKTKKPYLGRAYDLHAAAIGFLEELKLEQFGLDLLDVYFEVSKELKIDRIRKLKCDVFIDDLPEIFSDAEFPEISKVLFDPFHCHPLEAGYMSCHSWNDVTQAIIC
tara:strand:+ start:4225 stop:4818 length:594 start_codon:yes stop_codon:yes gene_type:complete